MIKVKAVQDNDNHWYLVPNSKLEEFFEMLKITEEKDDYELFDEEFEEYMTGGGINNKQLYIEI